MRSANDEANVTFPDSAVDFVAWCQWFMHKRACLYNTMWFLYVYRGTTKLKHYVYIPERYRRMNYTFAVGDTYQ